MKAQDFPQIGPAPDPGPGRAVVALFHDRHRRLLLQLRDAFPEVPGGGTWSLFGGGVEDGEDLGQALVREIDEELGLRLPITDYRPFGWLQGFSARKPRVFVARCGIPIESQQIRLGEGAGFAFFTAEQCRRLDQSPLLTPVLQAYFGAMYK